MITVLKKKIFFENGFDVCVEAGWTVRNIIIVLRLLLLCSRSNLNLFTYIDGKKINIIPLKNYSGKT